MSEKRAARLDRIRLMAEPSPQFDRIVRLPVDDLWWLLDQIPEEWPCPNPDDPTGCYCQTISENHLEGA